MRRVTRDVLNAIGMRRATTDWMPRTLVGFGAGLVVGAAVALMLSPKSGSELRNELATSANRLVKKGRQQIDELRNRMESRLEQRRDELQPRV